MMRRKPAAVDQGRLSARPGQPNSAFVATPGVQPLKIEHGRDGLIYVPSGYSLAQPAPLVVLLHGAGGSAQGGLASLLPLADAAGLLLLAPDSRRQTWDVIMEQYGPDIAFIDRAMSETFSRYAIDPQRIAIGGFSDGASYALSVGITNGDLFSAIIAFSPGFLAPAAEIGHPRIFITHGTNDQVLPIAACSRRIVPQLERAGYDTRYREFDGPHTVPQEIAREAVAWFERR